MSQEAWNKLRSQMNEMAERNKLLKKAVKRTYKKLTSVSKQYPKKAPNNLKHLRKLRRQLNLLKIETKTLTRSLMERMLKIA